MQKLAHLWNTSPLCKVVITSRPKNFLDENGFDHLYLASQLQVCISGGRQLGTVYFYHRRRANSKNRMPTWINQKFPPAEVVFSRQMTREDDALVSTPNDHKKVAAAWKDIMLEDFICAICIDRPNTCKEVAKISGCTHEFCFNCIKEWAKQKRVCPCCDKKFRMIEPVVSLPGEGNARRSQRDYDRSAAANKRKRSPDYPIVLNE